VKRHLPHDLKSRCHFRWTVAGSLSGGCSIMPLRCGDLNPGVSGFASNHKPIAGNMSAIGICTKVRLLARHSCQNHLRLNSIVKCNGCAMGTPSSLAGWNFHFRTVSRTLCATSGLGLPCNDTSATLSSGLIKNSTTTGGGGLMPCWGCCGPGA